MREGELPDLQGEQQAAVNDAKSKLADFFTYNGQQVTGRPKLQGPHMAQKFRQAVRREAANLTAKQTAGRVLG